MKKLSEETQQEFVTALEAFSKTIKETMEEETSKLEVIADKIKSEIGGDYQYERFDDYFSPEVIESVNQLTDEFQNHFDSISDPFCI